MIHEPSGHAWLVWLETSPFAVWMRQALWAYPAAETMHIVGIALLVGAAAMFDLRLLGAARGLAVRELARYLLPWSRRGLALVALSGIAMFAAHATEWAQSPVFQAKLVLIALAGANVLVFHRRTLRSVAAWDRQAPAPLAARAAAVASLVLWVSVITLGRLLGYV